MNPMAIADSGASHVILPQSALFDSKSAKPVNLRLAAGEIQAIEGRREIFAEHVTIPLCPQDELFGNSSLLRSGHLRLCLLIVSTKQEQLRLDAVSYQRRYTLLHSCAILDASQSFATSAEGTEAFSSFILETAVLGSYCRRSRFEDGS